jgi:ParB family transcriptional regulator, chromosome partitioning protein
MDSHEVVELNPDDCMLWDYADRQDFEMGDIKALGLDIKKNGQIQPIIVRYNGDHYEIIAGQRRWRACHYMNIPVEAIITDLSDEEALFVQSSENLKKGISPYSKAKCYGKILKDKKITQAKLAEELKISQGSLSDLLSFNDVPEDVWVAVGDVSKISIRTAMHIKKILDEDPYLLTEILLIAPQIKKGIGQKKIDEILQREDNVKKNQYIYDNYNNKIMTIKDKEIKFHDHFYKYVSMEEISDYIVHYLNAKIKNPAASSGVLFKTTAADGRDTSFYIPCLDFLHNLLFAFRLHVFQPYLQNIHLSKIHHPKELISLEDNLRIFFLP